MLLSIVAGNSGDHAHLRLDWNFNNGTSNHSAELNTLYSVDTNILLKVDLLKNNSGAIFRLTSDESILPKHELFIVDTYLQFVSSNGNLTLGSDQFSGCIYGTTISKYPNSCPLQNLAPCHGKGMYIYKFDAM